MTCTFRHFPKLLPSIGSPTIDAHIIRDLPHGPVRFLQEQGNSLSFLVDRRRRLCNWRCWTFRPSNYANISRAGLPVLCEKPIPRLASDDQTMGRLRLGPMHRHASLQPRPCRDRLRPQPEYLSLDEVTEQMHRQGMGDILGVHRAKQRVGSEMIFSRLPDVV